MTVHGFAWAFIAAVLAVWFLELGPAVRHFMEWLLIIPHFKGRITPSDLIEVLVRLVFILAVVAVIVKTMRN